MKYLWALVLSIIFVGLSACNGSYSKMEATELRERAYRCMNESDLTAPEIQVCKNILRECERREGEGQFDC